MSIPRIVANGMVVNTVGEIQSEKLNAPFFKAPRKSFPVKLALGLGNNI